jgi:hypothetical protein
MQGKYAVQAFKDGIPLKTILFLSKILS